jgi:hypothetical protein
MSLSTQNKKIQTIERIDRAYNIIFRTARIRIEQTKTNKQAIEIEQIYLPKIRTIFKKIVKEYGDNKLHLLHDAEKRYGLEIQTLIKSMVTRAYLLGIEYVSRATNKEHLMFLSNADLTNIRIKSDESYRMFWRLVTKHLQVLRNKNIVNRTAAVSHKKHLPNITDVTLTDEIFARQDEKDNRLLDPDTSAKLVGTGIVTSILAFATLQKYRDFKTQQDLIFLDQQTEDLFFEDDFFGEGIPEGAQEGDKVIFATEKDAKVCPICSALEGIEWDIDDPTVVVPETDTHPNCRCRLILKINGKIMAK